MAELTIKAQVDETELWKGVFGSGWENSYFVQGWGYKPGTDWDTPGTVVVQVEDPNSEEENASIRKDITIREVLDAVERILNHQEGLFHCAGTRLTLDEIINNGDQCTGDIVIQYIMYGEVVF